MTVEELKLKAESGDPEAMYRLAMKHIYGDGVKEENPGHMDCTWKQP